MITYSVSEFDKQLSYGSNSCSYRIIGADLNRSLNRKRIASQIREIERLSMMQNTPFLFFYNSLVSWNFDIL